MVKTVIITMAASGAIAALTGVTEVFGKTGQSLLRMFIQMALLGVGAGVGVLAAVLISQTLIFPIVLIYGLMITVAMGAIALLRFDTMEQFV